MSDNGTVAMGDTEAQFIKDAIRSGYDRGYNDARNAKSVPGDNALGYRGRDMSEEIATDVLARLRHSVAALFTRPAREPVAYWHPIGAIWRLDNYPAGMDFTKDGWEPLYAAPQPAHGTSTTDPAPAVNLRVTADEHNAAFDPANEALGGAFMAGFREGWIYAEIDADGERYQEMAEEYALAVDTAPGEAWDAHRAKFFAMLPLAAIPEVGAPIADVEVEIASVVQSVNEWDDRTSPDDYPEHLLITSEELADILRNFAATLEGK